QKTWLEAKENYENLPENSFNHPYEACKKSDSNSKYFFFYIKNTHGTEPMSTGDRLKDSILSISGVGILQCLWLLGGSPNGYWPCPSGWCSMVDGWVEVRWPDCLGDFCGDFSGDFFCGPFCP